MNKFTNYIVDKFLAVKLAEHITGEKPQECLTRMIDCIARVEELKRLKDEQVKATKTPDMYLAGLSNGLILACATLDGTKPVWLTVEEIDKQGGNK